MFFDSLGHTFKDMIIFALIIFTIVLSIFIIILNNSLHWWSNKCTIPQSDEVDKYKFNNLSIILSSLFLGVIGIIVIYTIYTYVKKGKIVGISD